MKITRKKENQDIIKSLRFTRSEFDEINAKAQELGMPFSTYSQDKLVNGRERNTYAKRKMITAIAQHNKHIDELQELLLSTEGDSIPKDKLSHLLEIARKDRENL